jgi:hypothetical protein
LTFNKETAPIAHETVYFFLWLYSPILGLGRLHETFRFISVSRSRTVGRTPWTGDQVVAKPLLTARVILMMEKLVELTVLAGETEVLGENLSRRHFAHHKSHLPDPGANPSRRSGKPATNRFSYGAARNSAYISRTIHVHEHKYNIRT